MKNEALKKSLLYVIVHPKDAKALSLLTEELVWQCILGGADMVQLRDKESSDGSLVPLAGRISDIARKRGVVFIVNDRVEVAKLSGADGVHLGQDDMNIVRARTILGERRIIGRSTHSLEQAQTAKLEGADYIGVGPVFKTPTKPDYKPVGLKLLSQVSESVDIPFFAIGNINQDNTRDVLASGGNRIAVVRSALLQPNVQTSVRRLKDRLETYVPDSI